ncbi:MAG TPA: hypothetical protein VJL86_02685, partial [Steroidobacteraceae bacterium]|nr:hypothetical protein [Steroidobacteraceae bacterium]
ARIAAVPAGTAARAADELLAAVAATPGAGPARDFVDAERPGPEQLRLQKALQARLAGIASALGIQPEVLATRRELAALARGVRDLPVMRGWRRESVGEQLLTAI